MTSILRAKSQAKVFEIAGLHQDVFAARDNLKLPVIHYWERLVFEVKHCDDPKLPKYFMPKPENLRRKLPITSRSKQKSSSTS